MRVIRGYERPQAQTVRDPSPPFCITPYRLEESLCGAALAHQGPEDASITPHIIDGPVRVVMIAQPVAAVAINVAHPYVSLT